MNQKYFGNETFVFEINSFFRFINYWFDASNYFELNVENIEMRFIWLYFKHVKWP